MGFSRKDFQSGSSCPPPGHLPDPGIKFWSPALQAETLHWATGKAQTYRLSKQLCPRLALSQRQGPERVKVRILGPWEGCWGWKFYSQWKQITPGMDRTFPGVVVDFDSWGWMEPICFPCLLTEKNEISWTSLVVQWLKIHLPMQGTQVWSLAQEDPTCQWQISPCAPTTEPSLTTREATAMEE